MAAPSPGAPARSPRPVVYLHVGAAKSGTTYLQNILWHNRERLREAGFLYPGYDDAEHVRAAFDLRQAFFGTASDPLIDGAWTRLVEEARGWSGTTIISQELFAPAFRAHVARALADLDFAEVHVVFTVRDLARQIPAHWQEDVKNRWTTTFAQFMAALRRPDWRASKVARLFWGLQDPVEILARWGEHLPPQHVHVVTLPRPGAPRDLLWQRFCQALGLPPDACDLNAGFSNPSLGLPETQLLLRLNRALDRESADWHFYNEEMKHHLAQDVLTRRETTTRIPLPAEDHAWAVERAERMVEALSGTGYDIIGDLDELVPSPAPADGRRHPDDPCWADITDASGDAVAAVLRRIDECEAEIARLPDAGLGTPELLDLLVADSGALRERVDALVDGTVPVVKRAVRTLSERHAVVARFREAYWQVQEERRQAAAGGTGAGETTTR
ncbi:hypothetical protein ACFYTC_10625 [Actinomadura nitritigenes]|uniref:hypothetical protein n=1 Tax=Actinomadura nitritigenes TaxID=134602 RepID=UPI0036D121E6